ncbi:MAG: hypothetical protein RLZ29_1306 [Actinomycetota bacterium]|jgi:hypothetical protein
MHIPRKISLAIALALVASIASLQPANAVVEWELVDDPVSLGMTGVSPHVEKTASGDRVWRSDGPTGTAVSLCTDAGVCASESFSTGAGGPINDVTIARTKSGQLRAYFKQVEPSTNTQAVYSAPCNDTNCLSLGAATLTTTAMRVSKDIRAWGVPDAVVLPNGDIRIYLVEQPDGGNCTEKIASYTSADGISFTKDAGWRLEGGYVDTEVLRIKNGEWLMILADIACTASRNQKLFVSTSTDGLTWTTPAVLTGSGPSRLDPTGYETQTPNVFRIYYSVGGPNNTFTVQRATLRMKDTAGAGGVGITKVTTPSSKAKTITCVKGKTTRKVVGTKCPAGFKKK